MWQTREDLWHGVMLGMGLKYFFLTDGCLNNSASSPHIAYIQVALEQSRLFRRSDGLQGNVGADGLGELVAI